MGLGSPRLALPILGLRQSRVRANPGLTRVILYFVPWIYCARRPRSGFHFRVL